MTEKTQAQIEAEKAEAKAAEVQAKKDKAAADKAAKATARAEAKAKADEETNATKASKADEKAAKEKEKADKAAKTASDKAAKVQAKADAVAAKQAQRQPEQNGVRRPGPNGLCGKVWALADKLSAELKQAVPIANLLAAGSAEGLNVSNIRTEYARWKKFHGLLGRIELAKAPETQAVA